MSIASDKQKLVPGRRVELFDLDLTMFEDNLVYHFCSAATSGAVFDREVLVQETVKGDSETNEVQLLTLSPEANAGTFTLSFDGNTSSPLPWSATAGEVQAAMDVIAGAGNTTCTGVSVRLGGVSVEFISAWGHQDVAMITTESSLTSPDVTPIQWRGNTYTPVPIVADGFEVSGRGSLPTPSLKISNVALLPSSVINQFGDPVGAKLTRWITYSHYLDDGELADPNEHYIPEIWLVERKKSQNRIFVEFELSAAVDQQGRNLPGRQILRDACVLRYRQYVPGTNPPEFVYNQTDMGCPWAGHPKATVLVDVVTEGSSSPAVSEQQKITVPANVTQGTFRLEWGESVTDPIAYNESPANFSTLVAQILGGNFSISYSGINPLQNGGITINFSGSLANQNVAKIVAHSDIVEDTEGPFFTATGQATSDPAQDKCGKRIPDCKLRFSLTDRILPFAGFPGVSRIKVE